MTAIAWAILAAAVVVAPERDRTAPYYEANNLFDCGLLLLCFIMMVHYS